jgi:hypothetical protein
MRGRPGYERKTRILRGGQDVSGFKVQHVCAG